MDNDYLAQSAPSPARDIGPDLCRDLILPVDRLKYDEVDDLSACTEMLALLSMVTFFFRSLYSFLRAFFNIFLGLFFRRFLGLQL